MKHEYTEVFRYQLEATFKAMAEFDNVKVDEVKNQIGELQRKIERVEERFMEEEITRELYEKFVVKYKGEKKQLEVSLEKVSSKVSNLGNKIDHMLNVASNVLNLWENSDFYNKQKLQFLIFQE